MINSLPDVILIHILSLLTTKEAVATSVLSKRWIHLFLFVPNLHFPDIYVDSVESTLLFNEFVYSILVSRDTAGSNLINSFRLDVGSDNPNLAYCYGYAIRSITKWVNLVVQRKLEHLRLHFLNLDVDLSDIDNHFYDIDIDLYLPKEFPKMPVSIFTCKTLVSLDLSWFRVDGFSFSSDRFQFPSLKTLKLEHIRFLDVRDFMLLLAGCPILEDLQLSEALLRGHENPLTLQEFKTLAFPKLLRADVQICCHCFPVNALSTIKYLCINTLKVLNIVEYWYTDDHPVIRFKMVNLLQRPYDAIPIFHNLTHLVLHNRWDLVVQVLQQCPKLQSLKICKGLCDAMASEEGTKENWVEPEFVPQCLLSDLKNCTVENFSGRQSDFMLEQFILKNARILQTMTIRSRNEFSEMEKKLSICPRASTTCQLNFMFVDNI